MVVAVLADEQLREEFLSRGFSDNIELVWADSIRSLAIIEADIYFDLLFINDIERTAVLKKLLPRPVVVNSVVFTCDQVDLSFIRINAWPTMLKREVAELAAGSDRSAENAIRIFGLLGWRCEIVPDTAGMVTPRIVSMIINEAWFALGEGVSTREEIDIAMKLGTNYPWGPFEWGKKLGLARVRELLNELSRLESKYAPAPALLTEL